MKKLLLPIMFLFMVAFSGCETEDEIEFATLTVTVQNANGTLQSGADVEIFDQLTLATESEKVTGSNGKAEFKLSESKLYSVLASKGSLQGGFKISNILFTGDTYEITVTIR